MRSALSEIIALEPSVIHSHDMSGIKIGAGVRTALLVGGKSVPWIHDLHEYVAGLTGELAESYMPVCLAWEREYLHKADHLITVSDALAEVTRQSYGLPVAPTITYNTPNSSAFSHEGDHVRSAVGLSDETPLLVFVGGATPLRGCNTIVEAVAKLPDVHLVFVSQGKYIDSLKARAEELGIGARFHTHPYVSSDQVTSFIRSADVGIHGLIHYPNAEVALPNKLFEYLHARLPVVVSDVASMKAFVDENGVGKVFIADDVDSCATAIREAFEQKAHLKSKITIELLENYSWEQQEKTLQKIYGGLLESPRNRPTLEERDRAVAEEKLDTILFETLLTRSLAEISTITAIKAAGRRLAYTGVTFSKPTLKSRVAKVVSVAKKDGIGPAFRIIATAVRRRVFAN